MAWNEPGNSDNEKDKSQGKDPWSGQEKKHKPQGFDDALKQIQQKFNAVIGGKGGDGYDALKGGVLGVMILIIIAVIWGITGFFIVQPSEQAVVLRFGKYSATLGPGLHWIPRVMDTEYKVNVQRVHTYTYPPNDVSQMLTKDQSIVAVAITVQFRVENPKNYLFNVTSPIESLQQATASALRQVIGQMDLDSILTTGREELRNNVRTQLEETLSRYGTGLKIVNVLLKTAQAPDAVQDAFDDAVKAQEDEKKYRNQAQAYAMHVEPIAQGNAKRILETAQAYKQQVVLQAKAQVAPFLALLPEYKKSPDVMRERLYIEGVEHVLQNSSKILVDGKNANNLLYMPLDKLLEQSKKADTVTGSASRMAPLASPPPREDAVAQSSNQASTDNQSLPGYGYGGVYP